MVLNLTDETQIIIMSLQWSGLLAQIPLPFLLLTSMNPFYNFWFELIAALLNGCLEHWFYQRTEKLLNDLSTANNRSYLDSRSYLTYVISNILLASSFKGDFGANNAHKDTNPVLCLVDLVTVPTKNDILLHCLQFNLQQYCHPRPKRENPTKRGKAKEYET